VYQSPRRPRKTKRSKSLGPPKILRRSSRRTDSSNAPQGGRSEVAGSITGSPHWPFPALIRIKARPRTVTTSAILKESLPGLYKIPPITSHDPGTFVKRSREKGTAGVLPLTEASVIESTRCLAKISQARDDLDEVIVAERVEVFCITCASSVGLKVTARSPRRYWRTGVGHR
jgi:hypothetical protein